MEEISSPPTPLSGRAIGFYSNPPFWAGEELDLRALDRPEKRQRAMEEVAYSHSGKLFGLTAYRDGLFVLQIHQLEKVRAGPGAAGLAVEWWGEYLDCCNCFVLLFESNALRVTKVAWLSHAEVTKRDVMRMGFSDGKMMSTNFSDCGLVAHQYGARHCRDPWPDILADLRFSTRREVVPKEVFDAVSVEFDQALGTESLVGQLAALSRSLAHYKVGNFSTSLVLSWFVIEGLLATEWDALLQAKDGLLSDGSKRVNADRRKILTGRDYSASVMLQVLELFDRIPTEQFKELNEIRKFRNYVVHSDEGYMCGPDDCQRALTAANNFVAVKSGLSIKLNTSFSRQGA
jgi:hypothetical protein